LGKSANENLNGLIRYLPKVHFSLITAEQVEMVIENQIIDPEKGINLIPLKKYITEINNNQASAFIN
jgi:IS30 family transposase